MSNAHKAGLSYFLIVFAFAFLFGTFRVLVLTPQLGALAAVAIEVPLLLAFAWPVCGRLIGIYAVAPEVTDRVTMGSTAFIVLMVVEFGVAVLFFGQPLQGQLEKYREMPEQLGLLGQMLFGGLPLVQLLLGGVRASE